MKAKERHVYLSAFYDSVPAYVESICGEAFIRQYRLHGSRHDLDRQYTRKVEERTSLDSDPCGCTAVASCRSLYVRQWHPPTLATSPLLNRASLGIGLTAVASAQRWRGDTRICLM